MLDQLGIVGRGAQAAGEGHTGGQGVLHFFGHAEQHGRAEDSRRDSHVADAVARQVARDGQGHADDAALAGGVCGLSHLAVVGGHAGGADEHTAFTRALGGVLGHCLGGQADHVEAADQVDGDGSRERGQRVRAFLAHRLHGRRDACTVDQAHQRAQGCGNGHHGLAIGFLAHIAAHETPADGVGHSLPRLLLQVGHDHGAAVGGQHAGRAFTQARSTAGDDENLACDFHGWPLTQPFSAVMTRAVMSSTVPVPLMRAQRGARLS